MVRGDVEGQEDVVTRVHSECMTGDVMGSLRCDCQAQLDRALTLVGALPRGLVVYLRQEGRGIGLTNKIRAYALQEKGLDTMAANRALGFDEDEREYDVAAAILGVLGVRSIALLTNNPDKVAQLEREGVAITRRLPHAIPSNPHNRAYLRAKAKLGGHWLEEPDDGP
jgi:GTP cyclohydrolase II